MPGLPINVAADQNMTTAADIGASGNVGRLAADVEASSTTAVTLGKGQKDRRK